ncbi:hypothetical protein C6A37_01840 [Desulfobacteraceae bacterium SEEP-SAG9]|nr:hypothetical protein C6A37_01840 [Desulfobacteraceae bacterium SEEP-SAG9]
MKKIYVSLNQPFSRFLINTKLFGTAILMILIVVVLLPSCAGKMSLDQAKQLTVSMSGKPFIPPPRRIGDILNILNQPGQFDPVVLKNFKAKANAPPPEQGDHATYEKFYENRGGAAIQIGRYKQALEDYRTAFRYNEKTDTSNPKLIRDLGVAEFVCGNFKRAIELLEHSLSLKELPSTYSLLVKLYTRVWDLESAEKFKKRGIAFCNRLTHPSWGIGPGLSTANMQAYFLEAQGKYSEAEKYYRKVISYITPSVMRKYPTLSIVAGIYLYRNLTRQEHMIEAEFEARRTLKEAIGFMGKDSEIVGSIICDMGEIFQKQGRLQDAEKLVQAGLYITKNAGVASDSYLMGQAKTWLGNVLTDRHKYVEAMEQFDQARVGLRENQYLYNSFFARNPNFMLALLKSDRTDKAMEIISNGYDTFRKSFGERHYLTAEILGLRSMVNAMMKKNNEALIDFSDAVPVLLERNIGDTADYSKNQRLKIIIEAYMDLLASIDEKQLEKDFGIDASAEAFKLADAVRGRIVSNAVSASSARAAAEDTELADLVRREQDALKQLKALQASLTNSMAAPEEQQLLTINKRLKTEIDALCNAQKVLLDEIKNRFPKYSDFKNPQPTTLSQAQNHLHPGEALVSIYTAYNQTYVWAFPRKGKVQFAVVPIGKEELHKTVVRLRKSLAPRPETFGDIPGFDLSLAYDLYHKLLRPVEDAWKDAKALIIIAAGPLGQLPFSVLPTASVRLGQEKNELFGNYRKVPWLIRKVSITRNPSVSLFVTLRKLPKGDPTRKAFAGFGDPIYHSDQLAYAAGEKGRTTSASSGHASKLYVRGLRLTENGNLDNNQILSSQIENLNRLPDTAEEIKGIAGALGADLIQDVFLGKSASEHQVKSMNLSDRRIIAFASHALVPGDLDGLDQPALALSAPSVTGDNEDGLLTMGEVLKLKMNADWVVLSACNTGAAGGVGAEAVSGLGRAFFYAGTRAILVSMWPVETTSARKLTTGLFKFQKEDSNLNRARALRKSILSLIDGPGLIDLDTGKVVASYAHPFFWAPFIIVGESGYKN